MADGGSMFDLMDGLLLLFVLMGRKVVVADRMLLLMVLLMVSIWTVVDLTVLETSRMRVSTVETDGPVPEMPVGDKMERQVGVVETLFVPVNMVECDGPACYVPVGDEMS